MTKIIKIEKQTKDLIDNLKSVCADYGLGNDGNEFKIITQVFLYKFLNDKFAFEVKKIDPKLNESKDWEKTLQSYSENEFEILTTQLDYNIAIIKSDQTMSYLFSKMNEARFAELFDKTLLDIAKQNRDIFSVKTNSGEKIVLFENISKYVTDNKDDFCRALINKLVNFSFEDIFEEKFDFYATIFEYLIKDYNSDSGGKYAEYFTPHSISKIMARCVVQEGASDVTCYDPSAGSGTLLMNLAHQIGEDKCIIYSQDISQKSSHLLRLNLILNNLVHSIPNIVKGNTIKEPYHKDKSSGQQLQQFDYIVSNPPFKLDFSDWRDDLEKPVNNKRFFAGIPNIPKKEKDSMAIYLMFLQHIMHSLTAKGKAAIVVPTGFVTAKKGIAKKIRQKMVESKMLAGVVSMPSNIFATTGTNVSILFLDATNTGDVVLIDASNLGTKVKEGKNQKTVLSEIEELQIIDVFNTKEAKDDFSIVVSYEDIEAKNYSLSAGQYFDVKIEYIDLSQDKFEAKLKSFESDLDTLFKDSKILENQIKTNFQKIKI